MQLSFAKEERQKAKEWKNRAEHIAADIEGGMTMTHPRKKPTMQEKLASALLHIRKGEDNWLVKGDLRQASAKEICAAIDWDHVRRWAEGGGNEPQNIQPLLRADHREKTRTIDVPEIYKGRRVAKKEDAHRARLAGEDQEPGDRDGNIVRVRYSEMGRPKMRSSRNNLTREARKKARERYGGVA